jgi:23S rRNA pseudouridine2605 synthase
VLYLKGFLRCIPDVQGKKSKGLCLRLSIDQGNFIEKCGCMDVLSKFLAHAGVCSRRKAGDLIKQGQVTVNGRLIDDPSYRVQPKDVVETQGRIIHEESKVYIVLNKPRDCITTVSDEKGRNTVLDVLIGAPRVRLYPVGRLDRSTTGLLVMTNDGEFANVLAHPRNEVSKVYQVTLNAALTQHDLSTIREGVILEDGEIIVDDIDYVPGKRKVVLVQLHSGKNRIIRRIFEHLGYEVTALDRIAFGGLTKKGLLCGQWRYLSDGEIKMLKQSSRAKESVEQN